MTHDAKGGGSGTIRTRSTDFPPENNQSSDNSSGLENNEM